MAKHKARLSGSTVPLSEEREKDVWYLDRLLEMARNQEVRVLTSTITIAECTHIDPQNEPVPALEIKRFYSELLTSGKAGIYLVQPVQSILARARKLRWEDTIYLKPLDSVHAASALHHGCSEIWTRDAKIVTFSDRLEAFGLKVVAPSNTNVVKSPYQKTDPAQITFFETLKGDDLNK
jgi:predicted nucleic acid-binding protein